MRSITVESEAVPVPAALVRELRGSSERTDDLDRAMRKADVLIMGRSPDEYTKDNSVERQRGQLLAAAYEYWIVDGDRLQQMPSGSILLYSRPRRNKLHPIVDFDHRSPISGKWPT